MVGCLKVIMNRSLPVYFLVLFLTIFFPDIAGVAIVLITSGLKIVMNNTFRSALRQTHMEIHTRLPLQTTIARYVEKPSILIKDFTSTERRTKNRSRRKSVNFAEKPYVIWQTIWTFILARNDLRVCVMYAENIFLWFKIFADIIKVYIRIKNLTCATYVGNPFDITMVLKHTRGYTSVISIIFVRFVAKDFWKNLIWRNILGYTKKTNRLNMNFNFKLSYASCTSY